MANHVGLDPNAAKGGINEKSGRQRGRTLISSRPFVVKQPAHWVQPP
jgi:hypothetical protein